MEPSRGWGQEDERSRNANGGEVAGLKPSVGGPALRLEVTAKELRTVFRSLDAGGEREEVGGGVLHGEQQRNPESLLAPDRREELCR